MSDAKRQATWLADAVQSARATVRKMNPVSLMLARQKFSLPPPPKEPGHE